MLFILVTYLNKLDGTSGISYTSEQISYDCQSNKIYIVKGTEGITYYQMHNLSFCKNYHLKMESDTELLNVYMHILYHWTNETYGRMAGFPFWHIRKNMTCNSKRAILMSKFYNGFHPIVVSTNEITKKITKEGNNWSHLKEYLNYSVTKTIW